MIKRMKHPLHGFHHAYSKQEEDRMRANGWVDDEPEVKQVTLTLPKKKVKNGYVR